MARPCVCWSSRRKPLSTSENELAEAALGAFINRNGTPTHTATVSHISTPALTLVPTPAKLVAKYPDADV